MQRCTINECVKVLKRQPNAKRINNRMREGIETPAECQEGQ
ncbi:hypothetical protein [Gracilibacillus xinjiangensis]|uniref:Uncharacterized protein n=1 Tax=Gracilibacillus xinjiangensis TaxID=1193282 RepID=A0ABV8X0Y5_9BACI